MIEFLSRSLSLSIHLSLPPSRSLSHMIQKMQIKVLDERKNDILGIEEIPYKPIVAGNGFLRNPFELIIRQ